MADTIKLVQGDTLPQLKLTLTDDTTNLAINLTGATVNLHVRPVGTSVLSFTRPATITDAVNGIAIVQWAAGDLSIAPGTYEAEVEVITGAGRETIYDLITLVIREDIA